MALKNMTKTFSPSEGNKLTLIAIMFAVVVLSVVGTMFYENWIEATTILTIKDLNTCNNDLGHINYPQCLKHLDETNQKDFSALLGADPAVGVIENE